MENKISLKSALLTIETLEQMPAPVLIEKGMTEIAQFDRSPFINQRRAADSFTHFFEQLLPGHQKGFEPLFNEIYEEINEPFIATLLEFHNHVQHAVLLDELGLAHGSKFYSHNEMDQAVLQLINVGINVMVTWQKKGERATIYIDNANFKQR
jgi:hypothetical protein